MNTNTRHALRITTLCLLLIAIPLMGYLYLTSRASNILLQRLSLAKPGVSLPDIRDSLGHQMYVFDDAAAVANRASITDPEFLRDRRLYWFYAAAPPCRAIEVYTTKNDVIVFATWRNL